MPNFALAFERYQRGEFAAAAALCRRSLAVEPADGQQIHLLALASFQLARPAPADLWLCRGIVLLGADGLVDAWTNRGSVLSALGRRDQGLNAVAHALALDPSKARAFCVRAAILREALRPLLALAAARQGASLEPASAEAWTCIGNAVQALGAPETAVAAFARSIALAPDDIVAHGNRLFTLSFMTGTDDAQLFKEARAWARTVEKRWAPMPLRCPSRRAKRLRIGYHSYEYFRRSLLDDYFPPLLRHHDRDRFEIVLMADGGRRDARTDELRAMADGWVELAGLDLAGKVGRMRAADLDIAVCLTGYLAIQRVVFAPRVAPIQVAHMNHVATTGLAVFDYRITDRWLDPPGETEAWNVERLVRLENGYVPVTAPEPAPALSPPPALANGYVTFGSFNNLAKVTQATLQLWGRVLAAVKRSRLLLKARVLDDPGVRAVYAMRCGEAGIPPDRIDFVGEVAAHGEHLAAIAAADIGLDPTPFSGGHTTVEALWMGVPVINLRSNSVVGRLGASLLCRAQLDAFLATSAEEYVETAAALARDLARLGALRRTMRSKLLASPLFDASAYTQQLEHAYEAMVRERR